MCRNSFSVFVVTALIAFAGATSLPATGNTETARGQTTIDVANDGVSVVFIAHSSHDLLSLNVRVAGPDGEVIFDERVEGPMIEWVPDGELADGALYQWEARAVTAVPGAQRLLQPDYGRRLQQHNKALLNGTGNGQGTGTAPIERRFAETDKHVARSSGLLQVEEGLLIGPFSPNHAAGMGERLLGAVIGFLVPEARAGQNFNDFVQIQDSGNDHHTYMALYSDDNRSWWLNNQDGDFRIQELDSIAVPIAHRLTIKPGGNLGLGTTQPQDAVHIRHAGPVIRFNDSDNEQTWQLMASQFGYRVADQTAGTLPFYIQPGAPSNAIRISAGGDIGIGTATPTFPLHVADTLPGIRFDDTNDAQSWQTYVTGRDYVIRDMTNAMSPVRILDATPSNTLALGPTGASLSQGSLFVEGSDGGPGNVGVGTFSPIAPLHVLRSNGTAQVMIEDTGNTSPLPMFTLKNDGSIRFTMVNTTGHNWAFSTGSAGFSISRAGTGPELLVRNSGNVEISGDVTANGVSLTSSRALKTDFSGVDEGSILEKVAALDVTQWRYKRDPDTERHIGPMAEDFQVVFGLGDGKHISAGDATGILFAAAKALKMENDSLRAEMLELSKMRAELAALRDSVAILQKQN